MSSWDMESKVERVNLVVNNGLHALDCPFRWSTGTFGRREKPGPFRLTGCDFSKTRPHWSS